MYLEALNEIFTTILPWELNKLYHIILGSVLSTSSITINQHALSLLMI